MSYLPGCIDPKKWCLLARTPSAVVVHYVRCQQRAYDLELAWFRSQQSLYRLVSKAALARSRGKRLDHQRRVHRYAIAQSFRLLRSNLASIQACSTFSQLHALLIHLLHAVDGIGPVYLYDTALRIGMGFRPALLPTEVYLHAGSLEGARRVLRLRRLRGGILPMSKFAPIFGTSLQAHEIENLLCLYRECL